MVFRSTRIGRVRRAIRIMWGIISSGGTGMGNRRKTGSKAVDTGIASSRLDGCCLIRIFMSLVASMSIRNAVKSANSK